jgi:tRNA-splicing ligase RtcB
MKTRELVAMGIPAGASAEAARQLLQKLANRKASMREVRDALKRVVASPSDYLDDARYGALAARLIEHAQTADTFTPRAQNAPYRIWGEELEADAIRQLQNACKLPVAVSGALMPDAHVGYGLPIGGVLATDNAVIPAANAVARICR